MTMLHWLRPVSPLTHYLQQALTQQGYSLTEDPADADAAILSLFAPEAAFEETLAALPAISPRWKALVVLSSADVYGEGSFTCGDCGPIAEPHRTETHLNAKRWEVFCPTCGEMLMPLPIAETVPLHPLTAEGDAVATREKTLQDLALPIPIVVLRLFEPYWPDPSFLESPTSLMATIAYRFLHQRSPVLAEDGYLMRDMLPLDDVAQAIDRILTRPHTGYEVYNLGSGESILLFEAVTLLQEALQRTDTPFHLSDQHASGTARHRIADIAKARLILNYQPQTPIPQGLTQLAESLRTSSGTLVEKPS